MNDSTYSKYRSGVALVELIVQLKGNNTHYTAFSSLLCESKLQKKKIMTHFKDTV